MVLHREGAVCPAQTFLPSNCSDAKASSGGEGDLRGSLVRSLEV